MLKRVGTVMVGVVVVVVLFGMLAALKPVSLSPAGAAAAEPEAEPAPPAGQTYTGAKACAACHFKQYMSWKKTPHSKTFELLTAKYEKDPECLKCHTTGYGEETGFKDMETTPNLASTTCESCHGPGSAHDEACKPFAKKKELTAAEEKVARDSIWRMLPKNVCVECHAVQGHGESSTPSELQKKS